MSPIYTYPPAFPNPGEGNSSVGLQHGCANKSVANYVFFVGKNADNLLFWTLHIKVNKMRRTLGCSLQIMSSMSQICNSTIQSKSPRSLSLMIETLFKFIESKNRLEILVLHEILEARQIIKSWQVSREITNSWLESAGIGINRLESLDSENKIRH